MYLPRDCQLLSSLTRMDLAYILRQTVMNKEGLLLHPSQFCTQNKAQPTHRLPLSHPIGRFFHPGTPLGEFYLNY